MGKYKFSKRIFMITDGSMDIVDDPDALDTYDTYAYIYVCIHISPYIYIDIYIRINTYTIYKQCMYNRHRTGHRIYIAFVCV